MLKFRTTNQFEKDYKKILKRGKDEKKILAIMKRLINQESLEPRHKEHNLRGNYIGRRECHIEPDWLLIYKIGYDSIIFERTGTHADLFG